MATNKKYLKKFTEGSMAKDVMALTMESAEERERKRQEKRKSIIALYKKGMSQTEAISALDELSDVVKFDDGLMKDAKKFLKVICDVQGITEFQALIFSALFCVCPRSGLIDAYHIGELIGKSGIFVLQHLDEIDDLVDGKRKLLFRQKRPYDCIANYGIRQDVFEAILHNERYEPKSLKKKNVESFLFTFNRLTSEYGDENNFKLYKYNVDCLIQDNQHLPYVKKLYRTFCKDAEFKESNECMRMFMFICGNVVRGYNRVEVQDVTNVIDQEDRLDMEINLRDGHTLLHRRRLIEPGCDDGLADRTTVQLTQKTLKRFLPSVKTNNQTDSSQFSVIKCDKITKKDLFYNDDFVKNVDDLRMLLQEDKFKEIQDRMKAKGLEKGGFNLLLFGAPGTGKTELCRQLARETGRDLLQVNISEVRSMWVGESEKNVQAIFDNYKTLCRNSQKAPILLFNEADAIINKRNTGGDQRAVEKMENSIVTILLQSMEDMPLNSILIATSNLAQQTLDSAFERRFMYKLCFPVPTTETRQKLWLNKLPDLSEDIARELARKFELSGGEIDNVVRRYSVEEILYGTPEDVCAKLSEMCRNEKLDRNNSRKIGFNV